MVKEDIELEEGQKAYYVENGNGDYYVARNLMPDEEDMKKRIYIMIYYKAGGTPVMIFTDKPDEYRSIISEEKKGEEASQDTGEGEQSGDQEQPGADDKAYTVKNYSFHNGALTFTTKDNKYLELNPDGSAVECNRSFSTDILRWSSNERELIDKEGKPAFMLRKLIDNEFEYDKLAARQQPFVGACRCCPIIYSSRLVVNKNVE